MSSRSLKVQVMPPSSLPHSLAAAGTSCPAPLRSSRGELQAVRTSRVEDTSLLKIRKVSISVPWTCQVYQSVTGVMPSSAGVVSPL